ncbi:endoplasmic reticulum vesicle transporter-domain-containing protein [Scheffersomyces amazonensis]|uniref:endoplasmic reticulum vesicle transporter-domain-containing protein n=1 Tax=Scheffersomyces amazonensis TaxID=1078765 RepID=UPI00315DC465
MSTTQRPKLISIDAFAKTVEDARIRTTSGGIITLICVAIVLFLIRSEYLEYTTIITRPELVVDKDINKQLDIHLDISFPNLPCDMISLDLLDETGDVQLDILQSGFQKFRLIHDSNGQVTNEILDTDSQTLNNDISLYELAKGLKDGEQGECGSCYGALPQDKHQFCCNSCAAVRLAYAEKRWGFYDGSNIAQCESEGYVKRINARISTGEGCRVKGTSQINRISGTLDFAAGASFTSGGQHVHDLSLYDKHPDKFNFDHTINNLAFGSVVPEVKSTHSLDGHKTELGKKAHLFSYYLKVVATRYEYLFTKKATIDTNQFSVITHDRPLKGGKDEDHEHTFHARGGVPGVFFHFDISPLKIINREEYAKTWSGFVLGVISSIAGVLMVGTLVDRSVYAAEKVIRTKKDL